MNFIKGLLKRYWEQIVKDYEMWIEFYEIKIVRPLQLKMWHYIKIYGIFKIIWKIILIVLIKIPIWWPFLLITYLWGLFLTYTFLPLVYFVEQQISNKKEQKAVPLDWINYDKVLYWILEIQWWLKTWLGLIHILDYLYRWWHKLPRFIDYIISAVIDKWSDIKQQSMRTDGAIDVGLRYLKNNQTKIKNNFYKYLWFAPKNFVLNWLNPHKYKLFRLIFYKNNRLKIYTWLYCRWLIRYKIFKGLVKYWINSFLYMGGRRILLRVKFIYKMIKTRCHIRHLYNYIALKIRKIVYYVCRELIYIWTAISLLMEIFLIFFSKLLPLFSLIWWLMSKILYLILCGLNFWFYNVLYTYEWYQIFFIKGASNSIKALQIQKKLGFTAKKVLSIANLGDSSLPVNSPKHITFIGKIKNKVKNGGNIIWRVWFGQEAVLFNDKLVKKHPPIENKSDKKIFIKDMNSDQDIWTRMWKACCPPLWFHKPEDVNSPNSKFRIEVKAGIGKGKQKKP